VAEARVNEQMVRNANCAAAVVVRFDDGIPETNQQQIAYNTQLK